MINQRLDLVASLRALLIRVTDCVYQKNLGAETKNGGLPMCTVALCRYRVAFHGTSDYTEPI